MNGTQQNVEDTPHTQLQYSQQIVPTDQWQSNLETLERTKHQMYLILHTVKFQKDKNHNNPNGHSVSDYTRSLCEMIKEILSPVIDAFQNEKSNCDQKQEQRAGVDSKIGSSTSLSAKVSKSKLQASMVSSTEDWHNTITHELRNHLIGKLIEAILPTTAQNTTSDERMHNISAYAQKSEEEIYESANSKPEYYYLLAEKIYDIQNRLKERRQKRKAEEMERMDYAEVAHDQSGLTLSTVTDLDIKQNTNELNGQIPRRSVRQQLNGARVKIAKISEAVANSKGRKSAEKVVEKKIVFSQKQLKDALLPTWHAMYNMPKGVSNDFQQPVDAVALPDYLTVVTEPMDLSTIKTKLTTGKYSEPWQYIDDVWLMFNNAWRYNKKDSFISDCCTQLSKAFNKSIDPVLQSLGYCCGQKYMCSPQLLSCYGKPRCTIARNAKFRCYPKPSNNTAERYTLCETCFKEIAGHTVTVHSNQVNKREFVKLINVLVEPDPLVVCLECGRKQHQNCALYHASIWPEGFVCNTCLNKTGKRRAANKFNAENLAKTKLSIHIETRVNDFLAKQKTESNVHIRVVYNCDEFVEAKPELHGPVDKFPYRSKTILVFQTIDGFDVCIFGMYVQEYGSECPAPNTRRVNIAYIDSVHFFKPKQHRTAVYHEILLGYMDYVKQLGYTMLHIWASPPRKGEDYIFDCHPPDQKVPTPKRLQDWYKSLFEKGKTYGIVLKYNDIVQQANEDELKSAAELPYFDGDRLIEQTEKNLENNPKKTRKSKAKTKATASQNVNDWCDKFSETMDQYKSGFFVARLYAAESIATLPPIQDPDPFIESSLLDNRDSFFSFTHENRYEFSSLQHVKYSTLGIVYALHQQERDVFSCTCDNCKKPVEVRYHCTVCDDFDLCTTCKETIGHEHPLEKFGLDETSVNNLDQTNPLEFILRWLESLLHVYKCQEEQCVQPRCEELKNEKIHMENCKQQAKSTCAQCKTIIGLHKLHAKQCNDINCPIPLCSIMKIDFQQNQTVLRIKQEGASARRAASIHASEAN